MIDEIFEKVMQHRCYNYSKDSSGFYISKATCQAWNDFVRAWTAAKVSSKDLTAEVAVIERMPQSFNKLLARIELILDKRDVRRGFDCFVGAHLRVMRGEIQRMSEALNNKGISGNE